MHTEMNPFIQAHTQTLNPTHTHTQTQIYGQLIRSGFAGATVQIRSSRINSVNVLLFLYFCQVHLF